MTKRLTALVIILATLIQHAALAANNNEPKIVFNPGDTITFPAELGTTESDLGKGFGLDLTPSNNGRDVSVFAPKIETVTVNQYESNTRRVSNRFELEANGRWLFSKAGVEKSNDNRYMVIRVSQIDRVAKLRTDGEPLGRAPLYASKIYYGWSAYIVLSAEASKFTTNIAAEIMSAGANFAKVVEANSVQTGIHTVGLRPKNDQGVVIATSLDDVTKYFDRDGEARPIFVEYTVMEGAQVDPIPWNEFRMAPGQYRVSLKLAARQSKSDGRPWDAAGDLPDLMVMVNCGGQQQTLFGIKNQLSVEYSFSTSLSKDSELTAVVVDKDLLENDPVGEILKFKFSQVKRLGADFPLKVAGQLESATMALTCESCN